MSEFPSYDAEDARFLDHGSEASGYIGCRIPRVLLDALEEYAQGVHAHRAGLRSQAAEPVFGCHAGPGRGRARRSS